MGHLCEKHNCVCFMTLTGECIAKANLSSLRIMWNSVKYYTEKEQNHIASWIYSRYLHKPNTTVLLNPIKFDPKALFFSGIHLLILCYVVFSWPALKAMHVIWRIDDIIKYGNSADDGSLKMKKANSTAGQMVNATVSILLWSLIYLWHETIFSLFLITYGIV